MRSIWPGVIIILTAALFSIQAAEKGIIQGTVRDAHTGQPMIGANIVVIDSRWGTISDKAGAFELSLPQGEYIIRAYFMGYNPTDQPIAISSGQKTTIAIPMTENLIGMQEAVVVGSRRIDRTVAETPVPIDVFTAADIEQTGLTEVSEIIQMLAPSFNNPRPTLGDGTDHVRPSMLRGMGPDQVLVLVNGKRRHTSALVNVNATVGRGSTGTDLNAIPANAIERIEILRDGAAAQYGSDAIAGVINIILRSDATLELISSAGQTAEGDGKTFLGSANYGRQLGNKGFIHFSAEFRDRGPTNRAGKDPRQQYLTLADGSPDPRELTFDSLNHRIGDADYQNLGMFINSSYKFGANNRLYLYEGFSRRNGEAGAMYRRSLDNANVREIYPDGFLPLIQSTVTDFSIMGGLEGIIRNWFWDLSFGMGQNGFAFGVDNSLNTSFGAQSPTEFDCGSLNFRQIIANLSFFRSIPLGLPDPVSMAMGAEWRVENYWIEAGEAASYQNGWIAVLDGPSQGSLAAVGSQGFPGFTSSDNVDESRQNIGLFVDLETSVLKNLLIGAAGRFEHYTDFGSNLDGKIAARYEPIPGLALRGAFNSGFRAPSLAQSWYSTTSTAFIGVDGLLLPFEVKTFPVSHPAAQALGASDLKAEKSISLSGGFILQPIANFSLSFDYYHITIDDRIVFSDNFVGSGIREILETHGIEGVNGGRYFTNAIDTRTEGGDLVLRYALDFHKLGRIKFTGGYNFTHTTVTQIAPTPPELATISGAAQTLFGRREQGRIEKGQPRNTVNLMLNYDYRPFALMIRAIRFGEVTSVHPSKEEFDQTFAAKWTTDTDLSYTFQSRIKLSLGAVNLFDVYPDKIRQDLSFNGIFVYNFFSPFGYNGRYIYAKISINFS